MRDSASIDTIWLVGALVLAVSALTARRLTFGAIVRSLLGWAVIGGVLWAVLTHRPQLEMLANQLADRLGAGEQTVAGKTVRITMSGDGHFWAHVTINGFTKRMLVDSGATITALSEETARNAGIEVGDSGFPVVLQTANGSIAAQRANASRVKIATLETRDLGVVVSPAFGNVDVLGMNFLSRLASWSVEGRTLVMEPKPAA